MKKIVASVGLAAVSAASVQGVYGQASPAGDNSKPWSIALALRGFYDDNVNTQPNNKVHAFGFEVSPSLWFGMLLEQSQVGFTYTYSYKHYDHPLGISLDKDSQTHSFDALFSHNFSERLRMSVSDSFVIGQEPDLLRPPNSPFSSVQRISGNNIRNYGLITFNGQITPKFGVEVGYANAFYDYDDDHFSEFMIGPFTFVNPSLSGLLDRLEHTIHLDARWQVQPDTVGLVGYQYGQFDYIGGQPIDVMETGRVLRSDSRNSRSHYGYVGLEHNFRPDLFGSVRGGVRYSDYYNSPDAATTLAPYAVANLRYTYTAASYVELGVTHDQNATDQYTRKGNSITTAADSTVVYGAIKHRLLPDLYGGVMGTFQHSTFDGGQIDNQTANFYLLGVNLEYRFNRHFSTEVGYNYDKVDSETGLNFDRNRVYIGATASF